MKRLRPLLLVLAVLLLGLGVVGWREAQQDPIVRRTAIALPGWPVGAPPVTVLLLSDIHVSRPDMTPARLRHIVRRLNRLRPDAVMIAGDFTSGKPLSLKVGSRAAIAPLADLHAPLGTYAVLGNNDHARGVSETRWALAEAKIQLLQDRAARVGPLVVGGIDDSVSGHADFEGTLRQMAALPGPKLLLSHGTNHFAFLPPWVRLMLAGHTHCGQARWLQPRAPCGVMRRDGHVMVVSAGLGTSIAPVRLGAPPDVWLLRLGPERQAR